MKKILITFLFIVAFSSNFLHAYSNYDDPFRYPKRPPKPYFGLGLPDTGEVPAPYEKKNNMGIAIQFGLRFYQ